MGDDRGDDQELVRVYATGSTADGILAKGRLESEGIPVMSKSDLGSPYSTTGATYLFVPRRFEEVARAILESIAELNQE